MKFSRTIRAYGVQILLFFMLSTLALFLYMDKTQSENDLQNQIRLKKLQVKELLRKEKLREIQRTIFLHPDRPEDERYNINVTRSERTPLSRNIPDSRPLQCRYIKYDTSKFYKTTVIIPFYNEALSMLLRTVHSVLDRTPEHLLAEIILVDDHSPNNDLHTPLENYIKLLPKVQLVRMDKREGLIRARLTGASMATGEVLFFQDAHTENNVGWLEPILEEIRLDKSTIVQPFVDQIEQYTIEYIPSGGHVPRGGFSWDLRYVWMEMPEHEKQRLKSEAQPFRSATLVGCALAVHKEYFFHIGSFDEAMNVWGGENIELAFRNWMCGGQVLTHPCVRVGHVFKPFAYHFDGDREKIVQKNLMRIAEVWMDDWKKYFLASTFTWEWKHTKFTQEELESLEKRRELKRNLGCSTFEWYLKNIVPEIPTPEEDATYYGEVASEKSEACWYMTNKNYVGMTYFCFFHRVLPQNLFHIDTSGRLKYGSTCLRIEFSTWLIKAGPCEDVVTEVWDVIGTGPNTGMTRVTFPSEGHEEVMCVVQVTNINAVHYREQMPQLMQCEEDNEFMRWRWTYRFSWNYEWGPMS